MKDIKWEIEIGELVSAGYGGDKNLLIYAVKEGEERRQIASVSDIADEATIEKTALEAVDIVARLNAGLVHPKGGIAEQFTAHVNTITYRLPEPDPDLRSYEGKARTRKR